MSDVPEEHWAFLEGLRPWHETPSHFFVHANAYPDYPLSEQPDYIMLYWEQINDPRPHESGKIMVCGHTSQMTGEPLNFGHAVCIDTWANGSGWLTGLDVLSGRYWQANQRGEVRTRQLGHAE